MDDGLDDSIALFPAGFEPPAKKRQRGGVQRAPRRVPRAGGGAASPAPVVLPLPPVPPEGGGSGGGGGGDAAPVCGGGGGDAPVTDDDADSVDIPQEVPETRVVARAPKAKKQAINESFVPGLEGAWIRYVPYEYQGKHYYNYTITCGQHAGCTKTRGRQFCHTFGDIEPLAFLHAWRHVEFPTSPKKKSHPLDPPTPQAVEAYVNEHREDLEKLLKDMTP